MLPLQIPVPIDAVHWSLAIVPLILLLVLLVGLQWQAPEAGPIGMFVAAAIALVAFQTPWEGLAIATAKGIWDALFILYVVWPALLLYHVIKRGGGFIALEEGFNASATTISSSCSPSAGSSRRSCRGSPASGLRSPSSRRCCS